MAKIQSNERFGLNINHLKFEAMKKEKWKTVIQVIVSILTAALTALGTTSCMGFGPIAL